MQSTADHRKPSQEKCLEALFRSRPDEWIPVYEIQKVAGFQYNARIHYLRKKGLNIKQRDERIDGYVHSWYMYETIVHDRTGQESFAAINTHSTVGKTLTKNENAFAGAI